MNKNLIMKHQEESNQLQAQIKILRKELDSKSIKLQRYTEVVKTFDSQIQIFEDFQKSSLEEMNKLKSQVRLFQELFQKEKTVNCELIRKLQPFMNTSNWTTNPSNQDSYNIWEESKAYAFDSQKGSVPMTDSVRMSVAGEFSLNDKRKSAEPTKLTQTMSKNLSFGKPLFSSNQSSKNRNFKPSPGDRKNSHMFDMPLQILSETSSDDAKYTGNKKHRESRNTRACEAFDQ